MQEDEDDMTKHLSPNTSQLPPKNCQLPHRHYHHRVFELICMSVSVNANDCGENLCEINFPFSHREVE